MKLNHCCAITAAFFFSPLTSMHFNPLGSTVEEGGLKRYLFPLVPIHDNRMCLIDANSFLYRFTTAAFTEYKEYSVKNSGKGLGHCIVPLEEFNSVLDQFIGRYTAPNSQFLNAEKWLDGKAPSAELLKDSDHDLNYRHPYAQKVELQPEQHILAFGDGHGSIHSLLRNLWRKVVEGFIDENLHIKKPEDLILFLGDLVDRGRYSVEVLYLVLLLKLVNDRCIVIRGNHEEPSMGKNGGLYTIRDEVRDKYAKTPDLVAQTIKTLNCVWDLLPHAVILGCNNHYKLVSHAGFDPSYDITCLIADHNACYECLLGKREISTLLDISTREKAIEHFNRVEGIPFGEKTGFYCCGFNLLDYARWKNSKGEVIYDPEKKITFSGHGYNVSLAVFDCYVAEVNKKLALLGKTFGGVVGGHFHTSNGLTLYDHTVREEKGQACDWKNLVSIHNIMSPQGFSMQLPCPIFILLSAPEGVGKDNAHGISVNFNKDSSCMITTGKTPEEWHIKPMEYEIPVRSENGVYCAIKGSEGKDPICCTYSEIPSEKPIANIHAQQEYRMTNDLDEEVEVIFKRLKKYLQKTSVISPDAKLQEHPLTYPIDPSIKTQSLNHIRYLIQNDGIDKDTIPKLLCEHPLYVNLVENALQQEIAHREDYYVFYHAHEAKLSCLHDILHLFYSWGLLQSNQPLSLRLIRAEHLPASLDAFLDATSSSVKNPLGYFDYRDEDENKRNVRYFDHIPEIGQQLLAVNYALFGNNTVACESSFDYLTVGRSINYIDIDKLLTVFFDQMQIPQFFLDRVLQVKRCYLDNYANRGILLQIFVKKEVIDEVAYWAFPGGKPVDQKIFESSWCEAKQRHTKIRPLLELYLNDLTQLNTLVSKGVAHDYNLNADTLQARLWLPSQHFYDPNKTTIFRYNIDMKSYAQYLASINEIVEEIVRYFIRQKLCGETAMYQHADSPMRELDTVISDYKFNKNEQRANQIIGMYDLEVKKNIVIKSPEDRFFMLAKLSKRKGIKGLEQSLHHILPLCKHLSAGMTPLIYAVKTNNPSLVEFLMNVVSPRPQIYACDLSKRTAFDWCAINKNNNCLKIIKQLFTYEDIATMEFEQLLQLFPDTTNPVVLKAMMNKMSPYNDERFEFALHQLIMKTTDESIMRLIIKLAEKWANEKCRKNLSFGHKLCTLVSQVLYKKPSKEILMLTVNFYCEKLIAFGPKDFMTNMVKNLIVKKTQDLDLLEKAITFAETLMLHDAREYAMQIAQEILKKNVDKSLMDRVQKVVAFCGSKQQ